MTELTSSLKLDVSQFVQATTEAAKQADQFAKVTIENMTKVADSVLPATAAIQTHTSAITKSADEVKASNSKVLSSTHGIANGFRLVLAPLSAVMWMLSWRYPQLIKYWLGIQGASVASRSLAHESTKIARENERLAASIQKVNAASANKTPVGGSGKSSQSHLPSIGDAAGLATAVSAKALVGLIVYKSGVDEVVAASSKFLDTNSKLMQSIVSIGNSLGKLASTGIDLVSDTAQASVEALLKFSTGFNSIEEAVDFAGNALTWFASTTADAVKGASSAAKEAGLQISAFVASWGLNRAGFNAQAYIEEGRALNALAEETARTMASQEQLKSSLKLVKDATESATASRAMAIEQARIAKITTEAQIDAELQALKARVLNDHQVNRAITQTKAYKKEITGLTEALEKQRTKIMIGDDKPEKISEYQQALARANEELGKLTLGEQAYAREMIKSMSESDENIQHLLAKHDAIVKLKKAQEDQKRTETLGKSGENRIANMKDELDLLTKSATKAQIEMRKMAREGYSEEQIREVGRLQEEIDKLNGKKESGSGKTEGKNPALMMGTKEANELLFKGVNAQGASVAKEQLTVLKQIASGLKQRGEADHTQIPKIVAGVIG